MDGTYIVKCPWYRDYVYDNNTYVYDNITYMHWNIYYQYFIIYTRDQMQFTAYVLHLTTYGLRLTAYGSRLTAYGFVLSRITDSRITAYCLYLTSSDLHLMKLTLWSGSHISLCLGLFRVIVLLSTCALLSILRWTKVQVWLWLPYCPLLPERYLPNAHIAQLYWPPNW